MAKRSIKKESRNTTFGNYLTSKNLFQKRWHVRWKMVVIILSFTAIGFYHSLSKPTIYKVELTLVPTETHTLPNPFSKTPQYVYLAAMMGVHNEGLNITGVSLSVLKSLPFLKEVIEKHNLKVPLLASSHWDPVSTELIIDSDIYDEYNERWLLDGNPNQLAKPSDWDAYKVLVRMINIHRTNSTGLVTLSVEHFSPLFAEKVANLLVRDLNNWMRHKSLLEHTRNIQHLTQELLSASISDTESLVSEIISEKNTRLTMSSLENNFVFRILENSMTLHQTRPNHALSLILYIALTFSAIYILLAAEAQLKILNRKRSWKLK